MGIDTTSADVQQHHNLIGGEWIAASGGARYSVRNPAHPAECLGEFADSAVADAAKAVTAAASAARAWADARCPVVVGRNANPLQKGWAVKDSNLRPWD